MVRTKADGGCAATRKVVAARAPRKSLGSSAGTSSSSSNSASPSGKGKYAGGNSVCQRPIPDWQKGIGTFMVQSEKNKDSATDSQSSSTSSNGDDVDASEESEAGPSGSSE